MSKVMKIKTSKRGQSIVPVENIGTPKAFIFDDLLEEDKIRIKADELEPFRDGYIKTRRVTLADEHLLDDTYQSLLTQVKSSWDKLHKKTKKKQSFLTRLFSSLRGKLMKCCRMVK